MPAIYKGIDVECIYPDNWKLSEDVAEEGPSGFTIESPDAAFFTFIRYPWTVAPKDIVEQSVEAMKGEYDQIEIIERESTLGIAESRSSEVNFYCLDLLVTSQITAFTVRPYTYLVQVQAEDRTFDKLNLVFDAILTSILRSLGQDNKAAQARIAEPNADQS